MRLETYLERSAAARPDKVCVVAGEQRVTYRAMDDAAGRLARGLRRRGVARGDRVVVFLDNSAETVASAFAAFKAGAVLCLVNPTTKADKLAFILNNSRATAVVTHQRLLAQATDAIGQAPSVATTIVVGAPDAATVGGSVRGGVSYQQVLDGETGATGTALTGSKPASDEDLATIIYTSGSTGVPKGVMMTHANLHAAVESITGYLENTPDDVLLCVLPLSFGYGLNQVLSAFYVGASVVVERGFVFAQAVIQRIQKERVSGFALVPTMAAILVNMKDFAAGGCPDLRYITNAAAAMSPAHLLRLQELFPTTKIFSMYGQTECTRTLYLPPEQLKARPASVGVAIPGTRCWVADEHGRRVGPGEVGELTVCGRHVTQGYWEMPEATARVIRPGPRPGERILSSGDLFRQDEDGYFYFVSRKDDIIKIKGQKVSPKEVEDVLYQLPGVREAVVTGVPDPVFGSALVAVVVPASPGAVAEADVRRYCAAHLEDVMVPSRVEFRDELPKTASGKLLRREVRDELLARAAANAGGEPTLAPSARATETAAAP
jgi:amino acid adenylation domain-containing protein